MPLYRLKQCFDPLTGWFPKDVLKQEFKGIQVTSFLRMNNFGHIEAKKVIFLSKCSKSYLNFGNPIKLEENIDDFKDNCLWT